jgi:hypothetical protein
MTQVKKYGDDGDFKQGITLDMIKSQGVQKKDDKPKDSIKIEYMDIENRGRINKYLMYTARLRGNKGMAFVGKIETHHVLQEGFKEQLAQIYYSEFRAMPYEETLFHIVGWDMNNPDHRNYIVTMVSIGIFTLDKWKRTPPFTRSLLMNYFGEYATKPIAIIEDKIAELGLDKKPETKTSIDTADIIAKVIAALPTQQTLPQPSVADVVAQVLMQLPLLTQQQTENKEELK